jgi:A/G-specific adenine glycosylase
MTNSSQNKTSTRPWHRELVRWFVREQRPMPWRTDPSPYKVWISEIMLQQTQVATVIPYFDRFVAAFPTLEALAAADLQAVLRLWEGLGYYSRARNLHRAARLVMTDYGGRIPETSAGLRLLPGIGPYTAAAIASIAFGEPVPSVDGNVLRVFARFWGIAQSIRDRRVADDIAARLAPLIRDVNPSHFNQALMETGALICRPRQPLCAQCLLARHCVAFKTGRTAKLPVVPKAPKIPHRTIAVGVIWKRGKILIARRQESGMLGGLWEFPGGQQAKGETLQQTAARGIRKETGLTVRVGEAMIVVKHAYSHFRITLTAFRCTWVSGTARPEAATALKWISPAELSSYPFPCAYRQIAGLLSGR